MSVQAIEREYEELEVGLEARFDRTITVADVDAFAELTGDRNPLHVDAAYARSQGFADRVVHGALLGGLVSNLVGMNLPGWRSLLLSVKLDFPAPTYPGDTVTAIATVDSLHEAQQIVMLKIRIVCGEQVRARGTAMVKVLA
ncbi:MAG TPA: MaoC family dehydratase [Rhodothermales bacterium]